MVTICLVLALLALLAMLSAFVVFTAFLVICTYTRIAETGVEIPVGIQRTATFWYAIGLVADAIYNWTFGFKRFGELRGVMYSEHIQDRVNDGDADHDTVMWKNFLNAGKPGHVREPTA